MRRFATIPTCCRAVITATAATASTLPLPSMQQQRHVTIPSASPCDSQQSRHPERMHYFDLNKLSMVDRVSSAPKTWQNPIEHPVWDLDEAEKIKIIHKKCDGIVDHVAYGTVQMLRFLFDVFAGFKTGKITCYKYINRCLFLETVAGVPGMVAGMLRHLTSLRRVQRDHGWIHTLLEEAENERMHLLTFMEIRKPGPILRCSIVATQFGFFTAFSIAYMISPRFSHRLVGYVEEEAVKTYTSILTDIDAGKLPEFANAKCPPLAISYWRLKETATFRDLICVIRADEAGHRLVNHTFADMHAAKQQDATNPFVIYDTHSDQTTKP